MSKSHSSLGRDLPPHPRRDPSRMGPGPANQSAGFGRAGPGSSRVSSLMDLGSASKMGPQRSHNMPPGSSSQNIPSIFRLGGRGPGLLSSQPSRDADQASNILASFGLSSIDLDELSRFPEDKITAENLPDIIQHLKRKRSEHMEMLSNRERLSRDSLRPSSDNWDDFRSLRRASFDDRPSGLNPVVDYGHGGSSRELSYRDRLDIDDSLRDRERFRDDRFSSDPSFRKSESDYNRLGYGSVQERSMPRGIPSPRKIDDFHGLAPKAFPHLCSLCDLPVNNFQSWDEHVTGRLHKRQCLLLLDLYPEWNPRGMGGDPFMLPQSTNPAPGILGPPPPPMQLGGPNTRHGDFRGPPGPEDMPRPMPRQGVGRVVHVVDFERGRNLKLHLMKLVEPFGSVTNTLILNNLNEAFIEMATPSQAVAVVEYYKLNPPLVYGKIVRVFLSQKYKRIKKEEDKDGKNYQKTEFRSDSKTEPKRDFKDSKDSKEEPGCVLRICNLPQSGYSDAAVVKLAETYGKVKTYILMRMKNQAFIEMEKAEDAQAMINRCEKSPLFFQGKSLIVGLSQKYKKLVLRIPNYTDDLEKKNRKRAHSPEGKDGKEKQKKTEQTEGSDTAELVTTEETDLTSEEIDQKELVSSSCEPALAEDDEEDDDDDEEAAALLETSVSGDEAEVPDITDLDQDDTSQNAGVNLSSTPIPGGDKKKAYARGNMQGFVTLDEVGDEEDVASHKKKFKDTALSADGTTKKGLNSVMASVEEAEQDNGMGQAEDTDADKTETSLTEPPADIEVGPYQVNNPVGVDFVIPKTGFYCKLCSLFYTSEDVAKVTHCSTLAHYKKFKEYYSKPGKNSEKKD